MNEKADYKRAYNRQRLAREKAESLLELRSRELYEANKTLKDAYERLKENKNMLVQQEKLASIGLLAAGIAHEINNPVGFVKSNLQTLEEYSDTYVSAFLIFSSIVSAIQKGDQTELEKRIDRLDKLTAEKDLEYLVKDGLECIKESMAGVERIEEIIANLSDFARTEDNDDRVLCDINELLDTTLKLVWNKLKYKVEIRKDYGDIPAIYGWPGQLQQVFVNIIVNATQAIDSSGTITLITRVKDEDVVVDIIDSGHGMDDETLNKLFDPFYTTKDVGSGTGLGLYVSHGIVRNHQGTLTARNNADKGACFTVTLPIELRKSRS